VDGFNLQLFLFYLEIRTLAPALKSRPMKNVFELLEIRITLMYIHQSTPFLSPDFIYGQILCIQIKLTFKVNFKTKICIQWDNFLML
jgi:hypothetical protein